MTNTTYCFERRKYEIELIPEVIPYNPLEFVKKDWWAIKLLKNTTKELQLLAIQFKEKIKSHLNYKTDAELILERIKWWI